MKKIFLALIMFSLITPVFASKQNNIANEESTLKVVPLITSSPLLGTGLGAAVSYLYHTSGDNSSKSQLRIGGQYSYTDSYSIFVNNYAFFNDNGIISTTLSTFSDINNEFRAEEGGHNVDYNVRSFSISQLLMFQVADAFYVGGQLSYNDLKYEANNTAGKEFIGKNAMVDEQAGGIGLAFSFDNRKINSTR